jgi:hypothetical protein
MINNTFEIIAGVFFFILVVITVASLLPLDIRKKGWKWIWPFLPVVWGVVFLAQEIAMRYAIPLESVPIRVDLLYAPYIAAIVCGVWIYRVISFLCSRGTKLDHQDESADHVE